MTKPLLPGLITAVLFLGQTLTLSAQTVNSIYSFQGGLDGADPMSGLITDKDGNLYGLTFAGGGSTNCLFGLSCGTVYQLTYSGGQYTESVIHAFTGGPEDGGYPQGPSLSFGPDGNLYGTTYGGGYNACIGGCGTVFRLVRTNGAWVEQVLYRFTGGEDGSCPFGSVIFDQQGNLYGTASGAGRNSAGTAFELERTPTGFVESTIYTFGKGNYDLADPNGPLVQDAAGNLYGEAEDGGTYYGGGIFKLTHSADGWTETPLHEFCALADCADGASPYGGLAAYHGVLYGLANSGGDRNCYGGGTFCGLAFALTEEASGKWKESVLYTFTGGADGGVPLDGPKLDRAGNLYGTTYFGGTANSGTIFRLTPSAAGWTEQVLYSFDGGAKGQAPSSNVLIVGTHLFTTAAGVGDYGNGAVVELSK